MATFTKRHYALLAKALSKTAPVYNPSQIKPKMFHDGGDAKFTEIMVSITQTLKEDNPKFDVDKFHNAVLQWGKSPEVRT